MRDDPLLQPFTLKHLTLKNRIFISSHEPAYAENGMPTERYRAYHLERARAGIAMTMTAGSASVAADSPPAFNNILAYKDEIVGHMGKLAQECHDEGCAVMIQLTHLGRRTRWDRGDWLPTVAPGTVREPAHRAMPKLIEDWDITRIITDYADAAERMKHAGLDGIELEAYGHLMDQFWSPQWNELDGPYGAQSLESRMKFSMEVLQAIRDRVGPEFIVGVRGVVDEDLPQGINAGEGREIAKRLTESGLIDFFNVIRGHIDTDAGLTDVIPIQGSRSAPHLDLAGEVKAQVRLPVLHAARIPDLSTARHAIASGKLDMVGMTRAHIADPHLVAKLVAGQEERIRPCVGANFCIDRIYQAGGALCMHNPSSGREIELPHRIDPAEAPLRVTVVGAGPAGLEAARVAALRGHKVTVLEAANEAGGQIRLTAQDPRRREMLAVTEWRMSECDTLGVSFKFNCFAEGEDVLAQEPQVVVVATGGLPRTDLGQPGADLAISAWDILSGDVTPASEVLIFDEAGDHAGLMAAERITAAGGKVELVSADRALAPEVMAMNLTPYIRALQGRDFRTTLTWRLKAATREGNRIKVTLGSDYGPEEEERLVDQLVVNSGTLPLDDLYFDLKGQSSNLGQVDYEALIAGRPQTLAPNADGRFKLFRIGDAVSARNTHAAVLDGMRLMRAM
ncbi:NADH:flavin oxidoreductase (plasmid) [Thioclava sp. 'Guangxiensis']|uniref:NADH:flavin oxidoreductase n=1 Tax=Thioclava sp. 'Guangxiensis' TaxID=3149044 RepID=UPI0032C44011